MSSFLKISSLLILFFVAQEAKSQVLTLKDRVSGLPVAHAQVKDVQEQKIFYTNTKGQVDISPFTESDTIVITSLGYSSVRTTYQQLREKKFVWQMKEEIRMMEEVVISSSKFEERKRDVAQHIDVLSRKDLVRMNQQTTADVLQQSGKVIVQKSQAGGGSPVIRGFEASRVLMVVDGVRMNNAIYRAGHLQNVITVDNSVLDKIEIVHGPGSVVYGSDALGGVVHMFTKNPALSDSIGKPYISGGSFIRYATANAEKTGHLDFNIGLKKIGFLTSLTFSDFDDLRQGGNRRPAYSDFGERTFYADRINGKDTMLTNKDVNVQTGSGYRQMDLLQKISFKPSDHHLHVLNFQYSTSSDIPRYDRLSVKSGGKPRFAEWYYGPQKRLFLAYSLQLGKKNKLYDHAKLIAAYQQIEESRYDRQFGKPNRNSRIENVAVYSVNADFQKQLSKHELRYGLEGNYNDVASKAYEENVDNGMKAPLDTRYPDGGSEMSTLAAYLTNTIEVNKKLTLNGGIRYSYVALHSRFNDTLFFPFPFSTVRQKNHALNGSAGIIYMPYKNWRGSLLASSGFRAPNVDDLSKVFESVPGRVMVPNPFLKPEYVYNFEGSISNTFFSGLHAEAVAYYTLFRNAITTQPSLFNGEDSIFYGGQKSQVQTSTNTGQAYLYGISANISWELTGSLSLYNSINYTYGRIRTDSVAYPLDHIPPVYGKSSLHLKVRRFRGEFFVLWNGWKRVEDYNMVGEDNFSQATPKGMPSWYTLNIRTHYYFNEHMAVQLALENILDRNYRVFGSGISAAGRNLILTVRANF